MRPWKYCSGVLTAAIVLATDLSPAVSLPETWPLPESTVAPNPSDKDLNTWLERHAERMSPWDLPADDFAAFKKDLSLPEHILLSIGRHNRDKTSADLAIKELVAAVRDDMTRPEQKIMSSPLSPFIYAEALRSADISPDDKVLISGRFLQDGHGSCAHKQMISEEITAANLKELSVDGVRDLLTRINGFRSGIYKRNALRKLALALPDDKRMQFAEALYAQLLPYPAAFNEIAWLAEVSEKFAPQQSLAVASDFTAVRKLASKRQCSKAKSAFLEALAKLGPKSGFLDDVLNTGKAIDQCYKGREHQMRVQFWQEAEPGMEKAFGFSGVAEGRLRMAYIHWSRDDNEDAIRIFADVQKRAKGKHPEYEAKALLAIAKIHENQQDYDRAAQGFRQFVESYPAQDGFEEALMSLTLIYADRKEWAKALAPLERLINTQTMLGVDERDSGSHSFALFWAGRAYLELGRHKESAEMWRRAASEYYSTFYGAMGHYLLEKSLGQRLALQPARTASFSMASLNEAFSPRDRERIRRIELLLSLGLKNEAVCELEEVDVEPSRPEKMLAKAMFLHAGGQWLDAIKLYDSLPRTFRHTLPAGMERILFPVRYEPRIRELAAKAEVDPDLVMAIIRQESVFNHMARSPVGALGLMQLMPRTAQTEAARLNAAYVSPEDKKLMVSRAKNKGNLLVADTNLTIGIHHVRTLLAKYKSPVFVLSAYNASPSAVERWMARYPNHDYMSFIERIPYRETRAYVKLVLRNYFYYKRWYANTTDDLRHLDAVALPLLAMVDPEKVKEAVPNH